MRAAVAVGLLVLQVVTGCGDDADRAITVREAATGAWQAETVVYAQALRHSAWNAADPEIVDLEGQLWRPEGVTGPRPGLLIVHGGGFLAGTSTQPELVAYAEFFAARGWVVLSIDYRLYLDFATLPPAWEQAVMASDRSDLEKEIGCAMYGAARDGKAAVRYLQAHADALALDPTQIAVMGGSAGAFVAVALGASEPEDFTDELSLVDDPTLDSTHRDQDGKVAVVLDHWGGSELIDAHAMTFGGSLWDATDAPIQIVHGSADTIVDFAGAEAIRAAYVATGVPYAFHPLEGAPHGAWDATVDGHTLAELGFDFLVAHQGLRVIE